MLINTQALKFLKKIVKNDSVRYKIIVLDTYLGSHKARIDYSDDFSRGRIIAGIIEAEYIANQHKETLELLEKETPEKVLDSLFNRKKALAEKIPTEGLYKLLSYFINSDTLMEKAGERLEKKVIELNHEINYEDIRELKRRQYDEFSKMHTALMYELQFIRK